MESSGAITGSKDFPAPPVHCETIKVPREPEAEREDAKDVVQGEFEGHPAEDKVTAMDPTGSTSKKRNRKPKSKRGAGKPTGFEEYYVDAPMTPEEYSQDKKLYKPSRPIIYRIEDALSRYHIKRRIETKRMQMFMKYLAYGGIDVGPKIFGGLDSRDLDEMDTEQVLAAKSQTAIASDRYNLEINFDAVVRGYLTSYFPEYFNPDTKDMIKLATETIKNFLNYLLYHDVCPDHTANINAARKSCDIAAIELWKNQQFVAKGPGNFNKACSVLYGGYFHGIYLEDGEEGETSLQTVKNSIEKVVKFTLAAAGSDEQVTSFRDITNKSRFYAVKIEGIDGFEVTGATLPKEVHKFYRTYGPDLEPVGKLHCRSYRDPAKPDIDLSPGERIEWAKGNIPSYEFEFFLEESLLKLCYPGMKVITSVWQLNCGLYYFDEVFNAYCSIYTVLHNDLMLGWKKPRTILGVEGSANDEEDSDV